mmetsp:Transcript_116871/g.164243  ORF Transcript_116871/g.164243 Transcript_116871/m.164243 type:complete len:131 (+) Transcript_116871:87-479(+)
MSATKGKTGGYDAAEGTLHRIRMTLTSRDVPSLEKVCSALKSRAKDRGLKVSGPVRLPTKHMEVTTRRAPSGNGTNTWDTYTMRVHSRIVELHAAVKDVKELTTVDISSGVIVDVKVILRKRRRLKRKAF